MFRRKDKIIEESVDGKLLFEQEQPILIERQRKRYTFIELEGALMERDERTGKLQLVPRGKLCVNVDRISGYYDNTVIVNSEKLKVMETFNQIALKILEATKNA